MWGRRLLSKPAARAASCGQPAVGRGWLPQMLRRPCPCNCTACALQAATAPSTLWRQNMPTATRGHRWAPNGALAALPQCHPLRTCTPAAGALRAGPPWDRTNGPPASHSPPFPTCPSLPARPVAGDGTEQAPPVRLPRPKQHAARAVALVELRRGCGPVPGGGEEAGRSSAGNAGVAWLPVQPSGNEHLAGAAPAPSQSQGNRPAACSPCSPTPLPLPNFTLAPAQALLPTAPWCQTATTQAALRRSCVQQGWM